ncbi:hypothetical protein Bbelb_124380 [Branchiostoma belcheri]|nr:hypothetical protein Bbelb_124380 [Branchiostoma belcheri]
MCLCKIVDPAGNRNIHGDTGSSSLPYGARETAKRMRRSAVSRRQMISSTLRVNLPKDRVVSIVPNEIPEFLSVYNGTRFECKNRPQNTNQLSSAEAREQSDQI